MVGIGAESILELLKIIDIDELAASLREETQTTTKKQADKAPAGCRGF